MTLNLTELIDMYEKVTQRANLLSRHYLYISEAGHTVQVVMNWPINNWEEENEKNSNIKNN